MSDLTPAELARVLQQHGKPSREYRGGEMVPVCSHCAYEKWPCLMYRLAVELQRRREKQLNMFGE